MSKEVLSPLITHTQHPIRHVRKGVFDFDTLHLGKSGLSVIKSTTKIVKELPYKVIVDRSCLEEVRQVVAKKVENLTSPGIILYNFMLLPL